MKIRTYKATSPSKRHTINVHSFVSNGPTLKTKLKHKNKTCGRNNSGKITVFHRGGSHKRKIRVINFYQEKVNGIVYSLEYDPNRNANIASIFNPNNCSFFYLISAKNLKIGDFVRSNEDAEEKISHSLILKNVPIGFPIFNISSLPNNYATISRSAGCCSILLSKTNNKARVLVNSGKHKILSIFSRCSIGVVSNQFFFLKQLGKAGRSRWLGIRPTVKGIAMNPVDHPNGGGEGKKSSKRVTPWGKKLNSKK